MNLWGNSSQIEVPAVGSKVLLENVEVSSFKDDTVLNATQETAFLVRPFLCTSHSCLPQFPQNYPLLYTSTILVYNTKMSLETPKISSHQLQHHFLISQQNIHILPLQSNSPSPPHLCLNLHYKTIQDPIRECLFKLSKFTLTYLSMETKP